MEIGHKFNGLKKKRKKTKKAVKSETIDEFIVDPALFDGQSSWLRVQELLKNSEEKKVDSRITKHQNLYKKHHTRVKNTNKGTQHKTEEKSQFTFSFSTDKSEMLRGNDMECQNRVEDNDTSRLTKTVAMDCEMVGTGPHGNDSIIARVSLVNSYGDCIYDEFVKPMEKVTDYRTAISGVRPLDLKKGKDLFEVQKAVVSILEGRRLVGHALKHDFDVLFINHPKSMVRDTSKYKPYRDLFGGRTPSLKNLTDMVLGCKIQGGEHSSVEDAQAAMLLYLSRKKEWEREVKSSRRRRPVES